MNESCFACTTPYQVMGAVSIAAAGSMPADLIIFGMFDGYRDLADRIRETGLFREVTAVAPERFRSPGRLNAFRQMIHSGAVARELLPGNRAYGTLFSSSRAHVKNILTHELIRRNPDLRIVIYDDGMGTYDGNSHVLKSSGLRIKAEKLLGWNIYDPKRIEYLVYEPELFTAPEGYADCPVGQMPKPGEKRETKEILSRIFQVTGQDEIREKVIIFDPLRGLEKERDRIFPLIDSCYRDIISVFGRENVIVKPHPRSTAVPDVDVKIYKGTGIPMEALYAGMDDLDRRILVTYASTAVYTPRMLFGKEPRVLALFRIADGESGSEWRTQFDKFSGMYKAKNRMVAPGDREELKRLAEAFRHNTENE